MNIPQYEIAAMTDAHARMISRWKYDGEYSFYDHSEANIDEYMDGTHYACTKDGELIGYFCFGGEAQVPTVEENAYGEGFLDVGLGLRPDLCGQRLGHAFVSFGLEYARGRFDTKRFRLSVAAFNERAIRVYQRAGFVVAREVTNSYFMNQFLIMTCTR